MSAAHGTVRRSGTAPTSTARSSGGATHKYGGEKCSTPRFPDAPQAKKAPQERSRFCKNRSKGLGDKFPQQAKSGSKPPCLPSVKPAGLAGWQAAKWVPLCAGCHISSPCWSAFAGTEKGSPAVFLVETVGLPFATLNGVRISLATAVTSLHR